MKNEKDSGDGETMFKNQEKERVDDRELGHRKIARTQWRRSGVEERRRRAEDSSSSIMLKSSFVESD